MDRQSDYFRALSSLKRGPYIVKGLFTYQVRGILASGNFC